MSGIFTCLFLFFKFTQIAVNFNTNNVDSDQLPRSAASDQRFHCLLMLFLSLLLFLDARY